MPEPGLSPLSKSSHGRCALHGGRPLSLEGRLHDAEGSAWHPPTPWVKRQQWVLGRHALSRATAFGPNTSSIVRSRDRCGHPVLLLSASLHEISLRPALPHHLTAVGIERVVDD